MYEASPHVQRRGWLKNGNPPGDFSGSPRCGTKTRRGTSCEGPAMRNGRCRLQGGLSTGAKTVVGIERVRAAVTKHGKYSRAAKIERQYYRELLKEGRKFLAWIKENGQPRTTGHARTTDISSPRRNSAASERCLAQMEPF